MVSERSLANLKPFKPGGDPRRSRGGRRKNFGLLDVMIKVLSEPCVEGSKVTKREMFVRRCVDLGLAGHPVFSRLIWEYIEGKPDERIMVGIYDAARELAQARGVDPERVVSILDEIKKRKVG